MKLDLEYLNRQYEFWKEEIGALGIWDSSLFKPVTICIRPRCKSYNGLFSRRWIKRKGTRILADRIFIYNNSEEFDPVFADSILVHEMIHQYIIQNNIKDTSTHGKIFRHYMSEINAAFPGSLAIRLRDRNPALPSKGPGLTVHNLILSWTDKDCYCCLIHPSKLHEFNRIVKRYKKTGVIRGFTWAQSLDVFFDRFVRCTKTLHGIRKPIPEMKDFCKEYNVVEIGENWLTLR